MVLLIAILLGLLAGVLRAKRNGVPYKAGELKAVWLVFVAIVPQYLVFSVPAISRYVPNEIAKWVLVISLFLLLAFVLINSSQKSFWVLGLGLFANLLVIGLNGGFMPIRPQILESWSAVVLPESWQIGQRFAYSKDIVLLPSQTKLVWLSDTFTLPMNIPIYIAFSLGDVFVAIGVFLYLFSLGKPNRNYGGIK